MIKQILNSTFLVIAVLIASLSCTKPVDFSQTDDLEINPVVELSLFHFNAVAANFTNSEKNPASTGDLIAIDVFNNNLNIEYQVQVDLLDNSNQLLYTFNFTSQASPNNIDLITEHIEVFEGDALINLRQTSLIDITLTIIPGSTTNSNDPGEIHVESKGIFYLNVTSQS